MTRIYLTVVSVLLAAPFFQPPAYAAAPDSSACDASSSAAPCLTEGSILLKSGYYDEAVSAFSRAVNREPSEDRPYYLRAQAYAGAGLYHFAAEDMAVLIERHPRSAVYRHRRGIMYAGAGQYEKALKDYDKAALMDPSDPIVRNDRAYALMRLGRFESAKADIDRALALEPKFPAAYLNYAAYYLYERHNSAQALKSIELAVRNGLRGTQQLEDENGAGYFLKKFAGRASVRRVLRGGRR